MKGLFVKTDESFPEGSQCEVTLSLAGQSDPLELKMRGEVQRRTESGMGIKFIEIDLEIYAHLKNLVMLNTPTSKAKVLNMRLKHISGLTKGRMVNFKDDLGYFYL